jgi:hypothetical protein
MQIGDTQIVVDQASLASSPNATNTAFQSPASAQNADKNQTSGLNALFNLASQGAQVASSIRYQRQQSGASARRQSLIAQCGRAPLFGRERKAEYRKCKADYEASLLRTQTQNLDENKTLLNDESGSSMKFIYIGLGVLALGGIAYLALKKK